ncbi:MAG: tetratricopeptide repeat protein, partial [Chloroflexi bacterium]|nr:tetratricopeptide repeat protein [Chloroflexota bacterium]
VTSRAPLQVAGEREFPVAPLALPSLTPATTLAQIASAPAVMLFVERAVAIRPDFALTETNAVTVAAICTRLDGLPLAIELAAARSRLLPPEALLRHLGEGLSFLVGARRDAPARQRTLRDAIAWSYDLLPPSEQQLFRQLSVCVGGFTLETAAALHGDGAVRDALSTDQVRLVDMLESLVVNNLVQRAADPGTDPRFRMLETVREFGIERLRAADEEVAGRARHLDWCLGLVERYQQHAQTTGHAEWLDRLESELPNLREALRCAESNPSSTRHGLRLANGLVGFWLLRGHHREARDWLARLLARSPDRSAARAEALDGAGFLAVRQNDYSGATPLLEEALAISREIGDRRGIARSLLRFGVIPHHLGDLDRAQAMLEESLAICRAVDHPRGEEMALHYLGDLFFDRGKHGEAATLYEQALVLARRHHNNHGIAYAVRGLGHLARARGEYPQARKLLGESLRLLLDLRDRRCIPLCLEGLACMAVGQDWATRAILLMGAAGLIHEDTGALAPPSEWADYQRTVADARVALGGQRFAETWARGAALSLSEAVTLALDEVTTPTPGEYTDAAGEAPGLPRDPPAQRPDSIPHASPPPDSSRSPEPDVPMTPREREVVALIAGGLSNREIATRLVLSVRTVERHIENVYNRLGITGKAGRAIVTAYALRHGLAPVG